jgi:hypothetical protein
MPIQLFAREEKIRLLFASDIYTLSCISGVAKCGDTTKKFVTRGDPIDITELCQNAGVLEISFSLNNNGEKLKTWHVEPVNLVEIDEEIKMIPAIEDMRQEVAILRYDVGLLKSAISELSEMIKNQTV